MTVGADAAGSRGSEKRDRSRCVGTVPIRHVMGTSRATVTWRPVLSIASPNGGGTCRNLSWEKTALPEAGLRLSVGDGCSAEPAQVITPRSTAPADGERRALRNLSAQYRVAAKLVRDAIGNGDLEWVRLVDPDAGRLDDVLIGQIGRVDAYQVKWSTYRSQITFNQLVSGSSVSGKPYPAAFKLMADGWLQLRAAYPDRVVKPHYLTHDSASATDGAKGTGSGEPAHLQGFLRNAWPTRGTWYAEGREQFRTTWRRKIDAIADCTGLSGVSLERFLDECELDLGFVLDEHEGSGSGGRDQDVEDLARFLMDSVVRSSGAGAVTLSRAEILRGVGWTNRFELSFKHDFPVDESTYRPVEETVAAIEHALTVHRRGYVALIGPPGSGKSTTLTQTLRYRKGIRLVRYYAFVRDDPRQGRGEAAAFLNDLCLSLEPIVPRAVRAAGGGGDLDGLRARLGALFGALHDEHARTGVTTVILIDGLDHIEREQSPVRSLIHELPHPNSVPEGVIVVLGTQRTGLSGSAATLRPIMAQLADETRLLEMARLSRVAVRSILDATVTSAALESSDYDRIEFLSGGHPLALAYLAKRLADAPDAAGVAAVLGSSSSYRGDIEAGYHAYWAALHGEPDVRELLGLVSRLRGAVELATVEVLVSPAVLERFVASARHYFRQDCPDTWRFFHNSFRQFVLDRTGRNAFDRVDLARTASFHRRLADAANLLPAGSSLARERPYHLEQAGASKELLALDHQAFFREQFLRGRSTRQIKEDIDRCIRAAGAHDDPLVVLRLMLVDMEIADRKEALEDVDLAGMEVAVSATGDRPSALMSGTELLVPAAKAMEWAVRLLGDGEAVFANRLSDAAEPLGLLSGVERVDASRQHADLDAWTLASWRFRPIAQVVAAAAQVRVDVRAPDLAPPHQLQSKADREARIHLLAGIAVSLLHARETKRLDELRSILADTLELPHVDRRLDAQRVHGAISGNEEREVGVGAMDRLIEGMPSATLSPRESTRLADLICRFGAAPERADAYLANAPEPLAAATLDAPDDHPFQQVDPLFRQSRALSARGIPLDPAIAIEDSGRSHDLGGVLFQRMLIRVANLWGEALRGVNLPADEVVRRLRHAIRFYRRPFGETNRWHGWHYAQRAAGAVHANVLQAARAHGIEAFRAVLAAYVDDWSSGERGIVGWSAADRRTIALEAHRIDVDAIRTARLLSELDADVDIGIDLHERVGQRKAAFDAWLEVGDADRARASLASMLATSFGVYHDRDEQIADWARLAARFTQASENVAEREDAARIILTIASTLHRHGRGSGHRKAVATILAALSLKDPAAALSQGAWLLNNAGAHRADVLSGLVQGQLASDDADVVSDALTVVSRLILPFELDADPILAQHVDRISLSPIAGRPRPAAALDRLKTTVLTVVQHRDHYRSFVGQAPPRPVVGWHSKPMTLNLEDGSVLTQEQLEKLAATPIALAAVLTGGLDSGIDWTRVVLALPRPLDPTAYGAIARWIIDVGAGPGTMLEIVRRGTEVGNAAMAREAADAAVARSRHYGWVRSYDGGSRQAAARCLVLLDPVEGRKAALRLLVTDYVERSLPARDLLGELEEILAIVAGKADVRGVWTELRGYVIAIAEYLENREKLPAFGDAEPLDAGELCTRLLLADMDNPAIVVAWEARKGLLSRLKDDDPNGWARSGLRRALVGERSLRTAALAVVSCLAWSDAGLVGDLAVLVRPMVWDEDGIVRRMAQQIVVDLGEEVPDAQPVRALPALYRLHLPDAPMRERSLRGLVAGEPLADTQDGVELSRLFHDALEAVEERTGHPFSVLTARIAQLMPSMAPIDEWSAENERALMRRLEAAGMKVTIRRPRSMVAHHAFGMLLAELCDAGELSWGDPFFDCWLLVTDPRMDTVDPTPRPDWLAVPAGGELGTHPEDGWFAGVAEALPTTLVAPDGSVVIAELTSAVAVGGTRSEEARFSIMGHRDLPPSRRLPDMYALGQDGDYVGREYPDLYGMPRTARVAVAGGTRFSNADFLALNPLLARHLGWTAADDGLFRWVDREGELMAQSVSWQEGNLSVHDYAGMDQMASSGWLVLATPLGWRRMRASVSAFVVHRSAGRFKHGEDQGVERLEIASGIHALPA